MANLATDLLRTVTRAFYPTDHTLVIEALIIHSTLPDNDLAHVLGMQAKAVRKLCGRLKEDGLLSVQTRQEKRTDGTGSFYPSSQPGMQGKERLTNKEWYYLNYHRAIDSIKYRMHKLNKHFSSLGLPATEKKDLSCPQCKSQWTELEVVDRVDFSTGQFLCARCGHPLDPVEEDERANENESVKRLNSQLEKVLRLMQQIDSTSVPENDFDAALARQKPVVRTDVNPAQRIETVDLPNKNLLSSKGLAIKPEKIAVSLHNDEDVKKASAEAEARERREKEARQNALPEWIAKSTVGPGGLTTVGAKEERERREREVNGGAAVKAEEEGERKAGRSGDVDLDAYYAELAEAQKAEAAQRAAEEEEDEEEDEDDFEDVDVGASGMIGSAAPANGTVVPAAGVPPASTGVSTPAIESSNATDDERDAKRQRTEKSPPAAALLPNGTAKTVAAGNVLSQENAPEGTPAASDEDEDDGLEFENV
ncbi:hypothetical protein LTR78_003852 [Recurvomyces mirabilis]|uniref:HTH TFE/IIEalpha-type domain-containing protein n=1 Tax=Recurvomyces mirabilis TaxID=574656 RepID=A0AAE0WQQ9_9PEZI|nr:hypothetical protein LTR78_003852 [Recurvomyces mirabilis]KAK5154009.1 hypothetical protein LTS14_007229 [Recurvomyces mirabilis]